MLLNRFFRLEMVKGDPNHHPRTLNAPFRAARHLGVQNNKTGSFHVWTPVLTFKGNNTALGRVTPKLVNAACSDQVSDRSGVRVAR